VQWKPSKKINLKVKEGRLPLPEKALTFARALKQEAPETA
jgi:hypothetical protein